MTAKKKNNHTPGPYWVNRTQRLGPKGNPHADLWIIESNTRKAMATLEVWTLNQDPKWRKAHKHVIVEHKLTLKEVEANAYLMAASADLLYLLELSQRHLEPCRNTITPGKRCDPHMPSCPACNVYHRVSAQLIAARPPVKKRKK